MSNVRRLARSIRVDLSADAGATWLNLAGRVDNAPQITPQKQDATDVDTNGFTSAEITLQSGVLTVKYNSLSSSGTPNPAQELVEGCVAQFGDAARLTVRWYDTDGGSRGYQAVSIVEVSYSKTGVPDLREVQVTFTLDGTITKLSQSAINTLVGAIAAAAPVVTAVTPSAVAVGGLIKIVGQGFATVDPGHLATAVKVGGTNVTAYLVSSDSEIVATMPAGSAGASTVQVTNPTGAGNSFAYTRGA